MKIEVLRCDECGKEQGAANHWRQIGVVLDREDRLALVLLGPLMDSAIRVFEKTAIHDICGDQCWDRHLHKLSAAPLAVAAEFAGSPAILLPQGEQEPEENKS
jgi:hypothetical protein